MTPSNPSLLSYITWLSQQSSSEPTHKYGRNMVVLQYNVRWLRWVNQ